MHENGITPTIVGAELRRRKLWPSVQDWEVHLTADRAGTHHSVNGHCGGGKVPVGGIVEKHHPLHEALELRLCKECGLYEVERPIWRGPTANHPQQMVVGAVAATWSVLQDAATEAERMRNNRRSQLPLALARKLQILSVHEHELRGVPGLGEALEEMVAELHAVREELRLAAKSRRYRKETLAAVARKLTPGGQDFLLDEEPLLVGMHPVSQTGEERSSILAEEVVGLFEVARNREAVVLAVPRYVYDALQRSPRASRTLLQAVADTGTDPETLVGLWTPDVEGPLQDFRRAQQAAQLV